jgi:hypothetical protein
MSQLRAMQVRSLRQAVRMDIRAATVQDADAVQRLRKHAWRARYEHPQSGVTREVLETELAVLPPTSAELPITARCLVILATPGAIS